MLGAVEWGTVGEWVSGLGALIAVGAAFYLAEKGHSREVNARKDEEKRRARDAEIRDLDETRRLLVIALSYPEGDAQPISPDFLGTVAHALARHSQALPLADAYGLMQEWNWPREHETALRINDLIEVLDARLEELRASD